jgi:hypothetical protein
MPHTFDNCGIQICNDYNDCAPVAQLLLPPSCFGAQAAHIRTRSFSSVSIGVTLTLAHNMLAYTLPVLVALAVVAVYSRINEIQFALCFAQYLRTLRRFDDNVRTFVVQMAHVHAIPAFVRCVQCVALVRHECTDTNWV